ncbi:MAG: diguanylate cyclase, partial [Chloroflexota bacterium]
RVVGSIAVGSLRPHAYTPRQIQLLEHLALQIAVPIENAQLYARAEQRARIDELTNLFNRRHFEERLKEEVGRHSRYGHVFSLLMVDLDSFKAYNDIYGHPSGDGLLREIGGLIADSVRSTDQAFRYGGDEFVVLLPQTGLSQARVVGERVRAAVAEAMGARDLNVTCSIGLAGYPADGAMPAELVTAADTALYYAKSTGGDRVYLSSKVLAEPSPKTGTDARSSNLSAVYALVSTVDARDHYTYGHSRRVNTYAVALAEAIGLSAEEVSRISAAALLHDIGKVGIPDKILSKRGRLTDEEWQSVKAHPRLGANIVGNVPALGSCVSGVLYHHERWDGTGYPEGLKGEGIPLDARILAIADAFSAMVSSRPYRGALGEEKALERMWAGAGEQFDPDLVDTFVRMVRAGGPEFADVAPGGPEQDSE